MSEKKNPIDIKRLDQVIRKTGFNDNFINAVKFHLNVLQNSNVEDKIESRMEACTYAFSKMFLDKMDLYPTRHFECQIDENSDWPLTPLPSEFFGTEKQKDDDRRNWFYASLNIGNVLDCRVATILPTEYKLRVIHKYGVTRLLDDLQLMAVLSRAKNEFQILEKELLVCDLVRVAVHKIEKVNDEVTIYVTLDPESLTTFRSIPKLGRISEDDLPTYVIDPPDTEKYLTYSDYLNSKPQFQNPYFYNAIFEGLGINPRTVHSYYPEFNSKECPEELTGQAILNESILEDVKRMANSALKCLKLNRLDESMKFVEDAFKICPKNDPLISKLYDIKYDIALKTKKHPGFENLCDLEVGFNSNIHDDAIKKKLLDEVFKAANSNYKSNKLKEAMNGLEFVLKHDENYPQAAMALHHVKIMYAKQLLEEKTLIDLQEKKKELLSELKKIDS